MTYLRYPFLFAILGLSSIANAHEFWIEPSSFSPQGGTLLEVRHCLGDGFEGRSLARNTSRIERFVAVSPAADLAIVGLDGSDPAGVIRLPAAGRYVLVYRSNRAFQEMPADRFEEYLVDKGLDRVIEHRHADGTNRLPAREAYSRHAKSLIQVGAASGEPFDRPIGLRLEFVADPTLYRAQPGEPRSFRLLYEGRPLAGALVSAARNDVALGELRLRTDAEGRVRFPMREPGMWRVAAVHMVEARGRLRADWESLWASLTFELPASGRPDARTERGAACRSGLAGTEAVARRTAAYTFPHG